MLLVCCTRICYLSACIKLTCCICAAHKTHSFCMYAAYNNNWTHVTLVPHTADEVCTHLSKVCTCVQRLCAPCMQLLSNCMYVAYEQLHTVCTHASCIPHVLVCSTLGPGTNFSVCPRNSFLFPCLSGSLFPADQSSLHSLTR